MNLIHERSRAQPTQASPNQANLVFLIGPILLRPVWPVLCRPNRPDPVLLRPGQLGPGQFRPGRPGQSLGMASRGSVRVVARRVVAPHSIFRHNFHSFFPSLRGLLVEFGWCLKRRGSKMFMFGLSTTKIQREDPKEKE